MVEPGRPRCGAVRERPSKRCSVELSLLEVGAVEPGALEVRTLEPGTLELGVIEPGALEICAVEPGASEIRTLEPGTLEICVVEPDVLELRLLEVSIAKVGTLQVRWVAAGAAAKHRQGRLHVRRPYPKYWNRVDRGGIDILAGARRRPGSVAAYKAAEDLDHRFPFGCGLPCNLLQCVDAAESYLKLLVTELVDCTDEPFGCLPTLIVDPQSDEEASNGDEGGDSLQKRRPGIILELQSFIAELDSVLPSDPIAVKGTIADRRVQQPRCDKYSSRSS